MILNEVNDLGRRYLHFHGNRNSKYLCNEVIGHGPYVQLVNARAVFRWLSHDTRRVLAPDLESSAAGVISDLIVTYLLSLAVSIVEF